jgi:hypothetical protein
LLLARLYIIEGKVVVCLQPKRNGLWKKTIAWIPGKMWPSMWEEAKRPALSGRLNYDFPCIGSIKSPIGRESSPTSLKSTNGLRADTQGKIPSPLYRIENPAYEEASESALNQSRYSGPLIRRVSGVPSRTRRPSSKTKILSTHEILSKLWLIMMQVLFLNKS